MELYMFRTVLLSIIRNLFTCTPSNGICYTGLWTTDDGQRNCPKHIEFHGKINL